MLVSELNYQKQYFIAMKLLTWNGSHPHVPRDKYWVVKTCFLMINLAVIMFLLFNAAVNHDLPDKKYSDMVGDGIMLLIGLNTIIKFWFLHYNRKFMADLFNYIQNDYDLSKYSPEEEKKIVVNHVKISISVTKHSLFSFFNGFVFFIRAVSLMSYYTWEGEFRLVHMYDVALPGQYNERRNEPIIYLLCLYFALFFGAYASTLNTGFEPLVPICLLHLKGQVQICSNRMKNLFINNKNPQEVYQEIKWINLKLYKLYSVLDGVNAKFGPLYEFTLKINTGLFPLIGFRAVQGFIENNVRIEFISFFINLIFHTFVPCEYSELLLNQCEQLREAIYSCNWEDHTDKKIRSSIIIMLIRTLKPMHFMAIFRPLCRDTFAAVCQQSYTIFNIIYAAWM